ITTTMAALVIAATLALNPSPPAAAPRAEFHPVMLASVTSAASSISTDLEKVRDAIDQLIRLSLFVVASPVVVPILFVGWIDSIPCFDGCGLTYCPDGVCPPDPPPPLVDRLAGHLMRFFFPKALSFQSPESAAA